MIKGNNKSIDEVFRKGLTNHLVEPPEDIWTHVKSSVAGQKKKRLLPLISGIAAGIAILIGLSLGILHLSNLTPSHVAEIEMTEQPFNIHSETKIIVKEINLTDRAEDVKKEEGLLIVAEAKSPDGKLTSTEEKYTIIEISYTEEKANIVTLNRLETIAPTIETKVQGKFAGFVFPHQIEPSVHEIIKQKQNWEIGFSTAPSFSYRTLSNSGGGTEVFNYLNHAENGKISLAGYLYVKTKLSDLLGVRTGIRFSSQGYTTGGIAQITNPDDTPAIPVSSVNWNSFLLGLTNSAGSINYRNDKLLVNQLNTQAVFALSDAFPASVIESQPDYRLVQNLYYLGLLLETFLYPGRKDKFYFLLGFEPGILLGNSVYFGTGESVTRIGSAVGLNKFYYSSSVGIGMEFSIRKNLSLTVEPGFQYFFSPVNSNHIVSAKPYSFGVSFGLNFQQ